MISDNKTSICFVVHDGKLECQALILVASIIYFNEDKFDLVGCIPENLSLNQTTRQKLIDMGVRFANITNPIPDYMIGNKLGCLSAFEGLNRVFLDTDILCVKEINWPLLKQGQIALKPADRKTYSWSYNDWERAYLKFANHKINDDSLVVSTCFHELMYPYYNAGVIQIKGKSVFGKIWSKMAEAIDCDDSFLKKRPWLDQLSLPLAIKEMNLSTFSLTEIYNFPAHIKHFDSDYVQLVHYHRPSIIKNNTKLRATVSRIVSKFPWLPEMLSKDDNWRFSFASSPRTNHLCKKENFLITGMINEDIKKISSELSMLPMNAVHHHPDEIITPLCRRTIPWGASKFFPQIDQKLVSNHRKKNIIVTMYIPVILSFHRIFQVIPNAQYVAIFSSPYEAINNWSDDYFNLIEKDSQIQYCLSQMPLNKLTFYNKAKKTKNKNIQKALLWCFFAKEFIAHKNNLLLVKYSPTINNINTIQRLIDKKETSTNYLKELKDDLSDGSTDCNMIQQITAPIYQELIIETIKSAKRYISK